MRIKLWITLTSVTAGAAALHAVRAWSSTRHSAVGFATPVDGSTTARPVSLPLFDRGNGAKQDAESPAATFEAFDFRINDYALIRWTDGGLEICRVWDWRGHDDLEKLLPNITARQARPLKLERLTPDHPLADVARRLITG